MNIAWTKLKPSVSATCGVIKDAGDDPDVTHGAEICATVSFTDQAGTIAIEGGMGVGSSNKTRIRFEHWPSCYQLCTYEND